ncbi:MAG: hypothetical protein O3A01_07100 [bacterium]|nr:hypothetical protein [bacterium]
MAVFNNKLYFGGGTYVQSNDALYQSDDGITWEQINENAGYGDRAVFSMLEHKNSFFIIAGYEGPSVSTSSVYSSLNGETWNLVTTGAWFDRFGQTVLSFNGSLWMFGGYSFSQTSYLNDVWKSVDGETWDEVTVSGPIWSDRYYHGSVVFDGKMWVIAGGQDDSFTNDIWYTENGVNWTQVSPVGDFWSDRMFSCLVVYDDKMWIIGGGETLGSSLNEVWFSSDGVSWAQLQVQGPMWSVRQAPHCVSYDGKLWVIGGGSTRDIWSLDI